MNSAPDRFGGAVSHKRFNLRRDLPHHNSLVEQEPGDRDDQNEQGRERQNRVERQRGSQPRRLVRVPVRGYFLCRRKVSTRHCLA